VVATVIPTARRITSVWMPMATAATNRSAPRVAPVKWVSPSPTVAVATASPTNNPNSRASSTRVRWRGRTPPPPAPVFLDCSPNPAESDIGVDYAGEAGCVGVRSAGGTLRLAWVVLADGWTYVVKSNGVGIECDETLDAQGS
jgi:hypothetical protein